MLISKIIIPPSPAVAAGRPNTQAVQLQECGRRCREAVDQPHRHHVVGTATGPTECRRPVLEMPHDPDASVGMAATMGAAMIEEGQSTVHDTECLDTNYDTAKKNTVTEH